MLDRAERFAKKRIGLTYDQHIEKGGGALQRRYGAVSGAAGRGSTISIVPARQAVVDEVMMAA